MSEGDPGLAWWNDLSVLAFTILFCESDLENIHKMHIRIIICANLNVIISLLLLTCAIAIDSVVKF